MLFSSPYNLMPTVTLKTVATMTNNNDIDDNDTDNKTTTLTIMTMTNNNDIDKNDNENN